MKKMIAAQTIDVKLRKIKREKQFGMADVSSCNLHHKPSVDPKYTPLVTGALGLKTYCPWVVDLCERNNIENLFYLMVMLLVLRIREVNVNNFFFLDVAPIRMYLLQKQLLISENNLFKAVLQKYYIYSLKKTLQYVLLF